jgi:hypothetical protein
MDIFGKLTPEMVLDEDGIKGSPSYHEPAHWGMDILKVGTSLGSGGIGYLYNDSIYRVGDSGSGNYQNVIEGPVRSRMNLNFSRWSVDQQLLNVTHQIDIIAGSYFYESLVTYSGTDNRIDLVAGIVNMKSDTLYSQKLNEEFTVLYTHDYQSEDSTLLTMALLVPSERVTRIGETRSSGDGVTETYFAALKAESGIPVPFRFYSLWEKEDARWGSRDQVHRFLKKEADRWAYPVKLKIAG